METDLDEIRHKAEEFYNDLKVPERIENILNDILYRKPNDVYGRLSEFFELYQQVPIVEDIKTNTILDSNGNCAVRCKIYSTVKNHLKFISSFDLSLEKESFYKSTKIPEDEENFLESKDYDRCCEIIQNKILLLLTGDSILQQSSIDQKLRFCIDEAEDEMMKAIEIEAIAASAAVNQVEASDEKPSVPSQSATSKKNDKKSARKPKEVGKSAKKGKKNVEKSLDVAVKKSVEYRLKGCSAFCLASFALLKAAARLKEVQCFKIIDDLRMDMLETDESSSNPNVCLPIPIVSVISAGVSSHGKVNLIKNLLIIGKPSSSAKENVDKMTKSFEALKKLLFTKMPVPTSSNGSCLSGFDKTELILNVAIEAMTNGGSIPGQDLFIGLEIDSEDMFHYDKDKYEVYTSTLKTSEELIDIYCELANKYSSVLRMIINPFRKDDKENLQKLSHHLSSKCFIVANELNFCSAHNWDKTDAFTSNLCNSFSITLGGRLTCSDIVRAVTDSNKHNFSSIIQGCSSEVCDDIISDLAVGARSTFLLIGSPCRGENVIKLNRLIEIEDELLNNKNYKLVYEEDFNFTTISAKTIEPEISE